MEGYEKICIKLRKEKFYQLNAAASKMGMNPHRALNRAIEHILAMSDNELAEQGRIAASEDVFSGPKTFEEAAALLGVPEDSFPQLFGESDLTSQKDKERNRHFFRKNVAYAVMAQGQRWVQENPTLVLKGINLGS